MSGLGIGNKRQQKRQRNRKPLSTTAMPICPCVEAGNEGMRKVISQRRGLGSGGQMSQRSGWPAASIWGVAEQKAPTGIQSHDKQDAGPSHKHQSQAPLSTSPERFSCTDYFMGKKQARIQPSDHGTLTHRTYLLCLAKGVLHFCAASSHPNQPANREALGYRPS